MYLISSCLVGINCRYNGGSSCYPKLEELLKKGEAIAVCPEVLGNLPIPRDPCEIQANKGQLSVCTKNGRDYTNAFRQGAQKTLDICQTTGVTQAILQSRSPSCGSGQIYDGSFTGKLIDGNGLTAELLQYNGVSVYTETEWLSQFED
ncbi:DUF523 domain-containing protein [Sunxiuqinia elliptica]|uniref:Uncharacterized protein YbbK (DUF523 family) n=1 Tax=Sunxiuqinia elliptica TaxID=655355 RepID=A0A4R6H4W8_9BACT|nr:DUF523 domain-containing protein [Sunxiuqinia elliptica]TDO02788.1 uncharacterized protein YbbK (DUF523 family) [Sunxiuqinia elliptica]TDO58473.1 uncharacterized protein YbbK (DUF523 family) [Sunxiuqinia elliptica]